MKLIHAGIIFSVIVLLFVIWNRDILFHAKGTKRIVKKIKEAKAKSGKLKTAKNSYKINNDNDNNDNDNDNDNNDNENDNDINRITDSINKISISKSILSDILSLNQAAHTLTRNGAILDKLIKEMKGEEACGVLMREYDLSSLMIMVVRRDEGEGVKEGFKKINLKAKEEDESESKSASVINKIESSEDDPNSSESNKNKDKLKIYSKNKNNDHDQSIDIPNNDNEFIHNDPHHTTPSDPLRIALYCKNLGREAGVGRVVRVVQSVADKDEKYVVELIK